MKATAVSCKHPTIIWRVILKEFQAQVEPIFPVHKWRLSTNCELTATRGQLWQMVSTLSTTYFFCGSREESATPLFCFSTTSLSFIPNLHSGIPDRKLFITTLPDTWALRTWPSKQAEINFCFWESNYQLWTVTWF